MEKKLKKEIIDVVYLKFFGFNKVIKINLIDQIHNEQYSRLCFYVHFCTLFLYGSNCNLEFPRAGWVLLDKQLCSTDFVEMEYSISYKSLLEFLKFIKKKVSFDVRCLKRFEQNYIKLENTLKFIEEIASTDEMFKRTQLRQIKRIYNQQLYICKFNLQHQPSMFNSLLDLFNFFKTTLVKWDGQLIEKTIDYSYEQVDISLIMPGDLNNIFNTTTTNTQ